MTEPLSTPAARGTVALTVEDQRLLDKALMASTEVICEIPSPEALPASGVEAEFWTPARISHVLSDCATYFRTLYAKHRIAPRDWGIDPDKLDAASRVAATILVTRLLTKEPRP